MIAKVDPVPYNSIYHTFLLIASVGRTWQFAINRYSALKPFPRYIYITAKKWIVVLATAKCYPTFTQAHAVCLWELNKHIAIPKDKQYICHLLKL